MSLRNTTFRLSDETRAELDDLAGRLDVSSGELKRRVVRVGIEAIKADLEGHGAEPHVPPALAGLIAQQKRISELVERQIAQAEKVVERQRAQADTILSRIASQQQKLSEAVEERVSQAEGALERQRSQVEAFLAGIVSQQRRLSEQVRDHLPGFVRRGREGGGEGGDAEGSMPTE